MMLQLEKMDLSKVDLICGDDIYYRDHTFERMPIFRPKGRNCYEVIREMCGRYYLQNAQATEYIDLTDMSSEDIG